MGKDHRLFNCTITPSGLYKCSDVPPYVPWIPIVVISAVVMLFCLYSSIGSDRSGRKDMLGEIVKIPEDQRIAWLKTQFDHYDMHYPETPEERSLRRIPSCPPPNYVLQAPQPYGRAARGMTTEMHAAHLLAAEAQASRVRAALERASELQSAQEYSLPSTSQLHPTSPLPVYTPP